MKRQNNLFYKQLKTQGCFRCLNYYVLIVLTTSVKYFNDKFINANGDEKDNNFYYAAFKRSIK